MTYQEDVEVATNPKRPYVSPRNRCFYMMRYGAIVSAMMVNHKYPEISVKQAALALDSCERMGWAKGDGFGFYEITEAHRVRRGEQNAS